MNGTSEELLRPFLDALPVTGASISTLGGILPAETVAASDPAAARLDELQLDLGEGPCWDAVALGRPVFDADLGALGDTRWPAFREAIREVRVAAIFAFPLQIGSLSFGAVDLYTDHRGELADSATRDAGSLADIAARHVLRGALSIAAAADEGVLDEAGSRTVVHQATGMVIAQLDIDAQDALLVMRGRAYSTGRTVRDIATEVVERRLDFSAPEEVTG